VGDDGGGGLRITTYPRTIGTVKPIELWGQQAASWTRASMRWLDRWRYRADIRLDAVNSASLRRWLGSVAIAAATVCIAALALHVLLLAALRSGLGFGWLSVAAVGAVAVVLLVVVLRSTVIALVAPMRRRAHFYALLLSGAALLAIVQACAAATVAVGGRSVDLWQAEQLYAWRLANSVPLLAIPKRLGWTQPFIPEAAADRPILLAFTLALIIPLARIVVGIYHLTVGPVVPLSGATIRVRSNRLPSIAIAPRVRIPRSGFVIPLIVAAGFLWGGLGRGTPTGDRIAAGSTAGLVTAVVVAVLGGILLAVVLSVVLGVLKVLWGPISDGPWMQLVLAAGFVWTDTPVRRALLPSSTDLAVPWKVLVTLGLWAVLTVLLLPIWVDPYLPESLLALGMLVAFAGAGAPGREWLTSAIGETSGGFALGPAVGTALTCLTGAYLAYLVSRAPARAGAGRLHAAGALDLRRELGGYVYIGLQIATAAAGLLMLLYAVGVIGASTPPDAVRSLLTMAWYVVDSLPGPDIPAIAGWQPPVEFTGPWAGAVVLTMVTALIVVVVFPMVRSALRWATLKAGQPAVERPLAEVPAALLADLNVVRDFLVDSPRMTDLATIRDSGSPDELSGEHDQILTKVYQAEERLGTAEFDRGKLRDLLGEDSPVYWAGDQAVSAAVDAYRTVVRSQLNRHALQWSFFPARGTTAIDAVRAIDAYAAAVDHWQMGADVMAELETRLRDLEAREDGVHHLEFESAARERGIAARERSAATREKMLESRETAARAREEDVGAREQTIQSREDTVETREREIGQREESIAAREQTVAAREESAEAREREAGTREESVEAPEPTIETSERVE
jgi:hypothetical protein